MASIDDLLDGQRDSYKAFFDFYMPKMDYLSPQDYIDTILKKKKKI